MSTHNNVLCLKQAYILDSMNPIRSHYVPLKCLFTSRQTVKFQNALLFSNMVAKRTQTATKHFALVMEAGMRFPVTLCRYRRSEGLKYHSRSAVGRTGNLKKKKKRESFWGRNFHGTDWISKKLIQDRYKVNRLMPNDTYMGRTAPLTSKCCISYIYSTNIGTEYFKHALYSPIFSLQNAICFIKLTSLVLYYSHLIYSVC